MKEYHDLVRHVLQNGTRKESRTGVDTLSTFGYSYRVDLTKGFPLLTTKRISWKNIVIETLWFLSGGHNVSELHRHGIHFWDSWADENGNLPSPYGAMWRGWRGHQGGQPDQIKEALRELRRSPHTRRAIISAWDPINAVSSALPPCHMIWGLNVQNGRLNLALAQRSADIGLGVPYNIASYSLILHLFASWLELEVGEFYHSIWDAHIYTSDDPKLDHVEPLKKQIAREPRPLPRLTFSRLSTKPHDILGGFLLESRTDEILRCFKLEDYNPHPAIKMGAAV